VSLNLPPAHSSLPLKDVGYVLSHRYAAMNRKTISLMALDGDAAARTVFQREPILKRQECISDKRRQGSSTKTSVYTAEIIT
jgi:hypothetical protein